jgi:ribonucleoside-diphosphate reductase alpha chain
MRERSVGLGVMGFHSFLQARSLPFEAPWPSPGTSKSFRPHHAQVNEASMMLATERGPARTRPIAA